MPQIASGNTAGDSLEWQPEALARLERVPGFARPMARSAVERRVRESGGRSVALEDFLALARQMGMPDSNDSGHNKGHPPGASKAKE